MTIFTQAPTFAASDLNLRVPQNAEDFFIAEDLLASQGLYSMDLVT
jgi:hypothetical protein